ncbi:Arc family DNA-binding protein [Paracoccus rhizosphaerae]|uniref:Arc family DNA-binding protein n=1 Tax=Paracoccus rhizosphaerae TaxID=1133347 RepID=A0ABV6CJB1_9RHOB|nr:Arc family DNA-binding protein [Paracoccus rhizosphaerae]
MTISTNRESDRFMLRLPDGMRDIIRREAEQNNRSMNAEIVATLQSHYESGGLELPESILTVLRGLAEIRQTPVQSLIITALRRLYGQSVDADRDPLVIDVPPPLREKLTSIMHTSESTRTLLGEFHSYLDEKYRTDIEGYDGKDLLDEIANHTKMLQNSLLSQDSKQVLINSIYKKTEQLKNMLKHRVSAAPSADDADS